MHKARRECFGGGGRGGENVAAFAAVPHDYVFFGLFRRPVLDNRNGVLRPVNRGAEDVGHARIEFEEFVSVFARVAHVLNRRDYRRAVRQQECPRFDFEADFPARALCEVAYFLCHGLAYLLEVCRFFARDARHFEAAAHVERVDVFKLLDRGDAHFRHFLPHERV